MEQNLRCKYCNKIFSNKQNLKTHQAKTKKCLAIQNKKAEITYKCTYCVKEFTLKNNFETHLVKHVSNGDVERAENIQHEMSRLKKENERLVQENERLVRENNSHIETIRNLTRKIEEASERERKTLTTLAMRTKTTTNNNTNNITNNYIIKVEDLTPITAESIRNHTFDIKYLTHYEIGEGIGKFIGDTVLKDNGFWSDMNRKVLSWRKDDVIIKDNHAVRLWELFIEALGEKVNLMLRKLMSDYSSRKDLDVDTKTKLISECLSVIEDVKRSIELKVDTSTQRNFLNYIWKHLGSKDKLIEIIIDKLNSLSVTEQNKNEENTYIHIDAFSG
jgi:uncharacterized C2H2 Zn-finger protein